MSKGANTLALAAVLIAVNLVVACLVFGLAAQKHWREEKERRARLERQAMTIEDAMNFDQKKFEATFDAVRRTFVPSSHALVFHYSNISNAQAAIKTGVPCHEENGGGVVFSLHPFHQLDDHDKAVFPSQEVVLACAVPQALLNPLDHSSTSSSLRIVSSAALRAVRGNYFGDIRDPEPWYEGKVFLPPGHIIRAYQLNDKLSKDDEERNTKPKRIFNVPDKQAIKVPVVTPKTCQEFVDAMKAIRNTCEVNSWVPLYHYTMPKLGLIIGETGVRMSTKVGSINLTLNATYCKYSDIDASTGRWRRRGLLFCSWPRKSRHGHARLREESHHRLPRKELP